jgi:hypothetical protein
LLGAGAIFKQMQEARKLFQESFKMKNELLREIEPMSQEEMNTKVDPDLQIAYAIDYAIRMAKKEQGEGRGSRELSLVLTKLQEADFWLMSAK